MVDCPLWIKSSSILGSCCSRGRRVTRSERSTGRSVWRLQWCGWMGEQSLKVTLSIYQLSIHGPTLTYGHERDDETENASGQNKLLVQGDWLLGTKWRAQTYRRISEPTWLCAKRSSAIWRGCPPGHLFGCPPGMSNREVIRGRPRAR